MKSLETINSIIGNQTIAITSYDSLNSDYEGFNFQLNELNYKVRIGKKTPKKQGYFTVIWIKDTEGNNIPYSEALFPDYLVVVISDSSKEGIFVFPKYVLIQNGIIKSENNSTKGKMGFRVYTPWDIGLNSTAVKTAQWQKNYFYEVNDGVLGAFQNFEGRYKLEK